MPIGKGITSALLLQDLFFVFSIEISSLIISKAKICYYFNFSNCLKVVIAQLDRIWYNRHRRLTTDSYHYCV